MKKLILSILFIVFISAIGAYIYYFYHSFEKANIENEKIEIENVVVPQPDNFIEVLQDYLTKPNKLDYIEYIGFPDENGSHGQFVTFIKNYISNGRLVVETINMFQGQKTAEIVEYCTYSDESLIMDRLSSKSIFGGSDQMVNKPLIKLPQNNQITEWSYVDTDGTELFYTSEFITIDYQGKKTKAIRVSEKNSLFKKITNYRVFLKNVGFYEEYTQDEKGQRKATMRLIKNSKADQDKQLSLKTNAKNQNTSNANIVKAGSIGDIALGDNINSLNENYVLERTAKTDEEGGNYTVYKVYRNKNLLFKMVPKFDENYEQTDLIGEIEIFSSDYKTTKKISVGSTLEDFIEAYPKYSLWYTYISDRFIIDTEELELVQFQIEDSEYIGNKDSIANSDRVMLERNKFKQKAKIISIRVF